MRSAILIVATACASLTAFYLLLDPRSHASAAQEAMLAQYLKVYCNKHPPRDFAGQIFAGGEAAALSRVTISAGIGELALAEYAKCKILGEQLK